MVPFYLEYREFRDVVELPVGNVSTIIVPAIIEADEQDRYCKKIKDPPRQAAVGVDESPQGLECIIANDSVGGESKTDYRPDVHAGYQIHRCLPGDNWHKYASGFLASVG